MGRMAKPSGGGITKYYWYPGEKSDWIRAGIALGSGLLSFALMALMTKSGLWASIVGTSVTAGVAGVSFGRRDARALECFNGFAVVDTGKAVWRALVKGVGAAGAAVLVANMAPRGFWVDWVLPLVPATVGALAHQGGMLWERAAKVSAASAVSASESEVAKASIANAGAPGKPAAGRAKGHAEGADSIPGHAVDAKPDQATPQSTPVHSPIRSVRLGIREA